MVSFYHKSCVVSLIERDQGHCLGLYSQEQADEDQPVKCNNNIVMLSCYVVLLSIPQHTYNALQNIKFLST